MNTSRTASLIVGLFMIAGFGSLAFVALYISDITALSSPARYQLEARFESVNGLKKRSPVRAGGVPVGEVASIRYDKNHYQAVVVFDIDAEFDTFPLDSSAAIYTSGLLGEKYVGIEPGAEEEFLGPGDSIELTQSSIVLEKVISEFLYNRASTPAESE